MRQLMDVRFWEEKNNREKRIVRRRIIAQTRSHVRKKKVQTIFMKNRLMMRMKMMTRIVQKRSHVHVRKKNVHTIFMKNRLIMRIRWGMVIIIIIIMCAKKKRFIRYSWTNPIARRKDAGTHTGTVCERFTKRRIIIPIGSMMTIL